MDYQQQYTPQQPPQFQQQPPHSSNLLDFRVQVFPTLAHLVHPCLGLVALTNLRQRRAALGSLLNRLSDMFKDTQAIGGKVLNLHATLPKLGALTPREDLKMLGASKESTLLQPSSPICIYKELGYRLLKDT
ncbi:COPII subunit, partial [Mortierella sp. GBA43]